MPESTQEKLKRVRRPRVHITYDVETEGAKVVKELPFVMGVLGNFSGMRLKLEPLAERKFIEINRGNFDSVMQRMKPVLDINVENTLKGDASKFKVLLEFESLRDFEPASIINQVEPLRRLLEQRNNLRDLASKADRSAELEAVLERILKNPDDRKQLSTALGFPDNAPGAVDEPPHAPSGDGEKS